MLAIVGVSHKSAPVEVREALAYGRDKLAKALRIINAETGASEAMILSTCNRVEIYAWLDADERSDTLASFFARSHERSLEEIDKSVYRLSGDAAVLHAFRVTASLDSMVVGESQILGQVKDAYQLAEDAGALGPFLGALRNRTLMAAKRARTETGIGRNAVSVSHVAVELARKIFGSLVGRHVLIVGAGKMSELAARRLVRDGAVATVTGSRSHCRCEELAARIGASAVPLEALRAEIARADVVLGGTGASDYVIRRDDVAAAIVARRHRPLFLVDIAVPRDIDPVVAEIEGVFLYDIDDLKVVAQANLRERQKEASAAEAIVAAEAREFRAWQRTLDVVPLLVALKERAEAVRRLEIERTRRKHGPLTPEQEAALEAATTSAMNKLLHPTIVRLKELARKGCSPQDMDAMRRLLGL